MFIDINPFLHMIDLQTHFRATTFVSSVIVESVRLAFFECWAFTYTYFSDRIKADQGRQFVCPCLKDLTDVSGIELKVSGMEIHNYLGAGERFQDPLRRNCNKIRYDSYRVHPQLALKIAVNAINDTMNPDGIAPSLLVFGVLPRFAVYLTDLPNQADRMKALQFSRSEI